MRTIRRTSAFERDYRREKRGRFADVLDEELEEIAALLAADDPLPPRRRDHALAGQRRDHRDCHLCPDLVLIYRKPDAESLEFVRMASSGFNLRLSYS